MNIELLISRSSYLVEVGVENKASATAATRSFSRVEAQGNAYPPALFLARGGGGERQSLTRPNSLFAPSRSKKSQDQRSNSHCPHPTCPSHYFKAYAGFPLNVCWEFQAGRLDLFCREKREGGRGIVGMLGKERRGLMLCLDVVSFMVVPFYRRSSSCRSDLFHICSLSHLLLSRISSCQHHCNYATMRVIVSWSGIIIRVGGDGPGRATFQAKLDLKRRSAHTEDLARTLERRSPRANAAPSVTHRGNSVPYQLAV